MASIEKASTNTDEYPTSKQPDKLSPEELLGGNNLNNREEATGGSLKIAPSLPERQVEEQKKPASSQGMEAPHNEPPVGGEEDDTSSAGMTASDQEWLERLEELHAFMTEHGTPPQEQDNESLSKWLQEQLAANMERTLAPDRRQVLAHFITSFAKPPRPAQELQWEKMYESLCQFKEQNGHMRPNNGNCNDKKLEKWVQTQKYLYRKKKLRPDRLVKLENLGMKWDHRTVLFEARWNSMYERLCQFKEKNGHVNPNHHGNCNDKKLAKWVALQISLYNRKKLRPDRLVKLENLGMKWDYGQAKTSSLPSARNEARWNSMYERLCLFKEKNGHLRPSRRGNCDEKSLANWLGNQRFKAQKLPPHRVQKLKSLGIICPPEPNALDTSTDGLFDGEGEYEQQHGVDSMTCPTDVKPASTENERRGLRKRPVNSSSSKKRGACSEELPALPKPRLSGLCGLLENVASSRRGQSAEHAALAEEPNSSAISATSAASSPKSEDSAKRIKTKNELKLVTMKTAPNASLDEQRPVSISHEGQHINTKTVVRTETSEVGLVENVSVPKSSIAVIQGGETSHDPALNQSVSKSALRATPPMYQGKKMNGKAPSVGTGRPVVRTSKPIEGHSISTTKRAIATTTSEQQAKKHTHSATNDTRSKDAWGVNVVTRDIVSWDEGFGHLCDYKEETGDCNVPESDYILFKWVCNQRKLHVQGKLSNHRYGKLTGIGFEWRTNIEIPTLAVSVGLKRSSSYSTKPQKKHKVAFQSLDRHGRCSPPLLPSSGVEASLPQDHARPINNTRDKTTGSSLVRSRVAKYFADDLYQGTVTRHFPAHLTEEGVDLWRIDYDDGDKEDVDEAEIRSLVKVYQV